MSANTKVPLQALVGRAVSLSLLLVLVAGCASGPSLYQRAYDYCIERGGAAYECDRFARDEVMHESRRMSEAIRLGQESVAEGARTPHARRSPPRTSEPVYVKPTGRCSYRYVTDAQTGQQVYARVCD
jgi:hypothetical protein